MKTCLLLLIALAALTACENKETDPYKGKTTGAGGGGPGYDGTGTGPAGTNINRGNEPASK